MNASTLNELRGVIPARDLADEKMNQVRELLVGDLAREVQARMAEIETRTRELEARSEQAAVHAREFETGIAQQLTMLHERLDEIASNHTATRRDSFDELSKCMQELADKIRAIAR